MAAVSRNVHKLTALSNGLRVVTAKAPSAVTSIGVFVDGGSRSETEHNNGISALAARLTLKGSTGRKQAQLEKEVSALGATLQSYSCTDKSSFVFRAQPKATGKALEILADLVSNPAFEAAHVEAEKKAVVEELNSKKQPADVVQHYLRATAFQGTALGQDPAGTTKSIKALTRDDLVKHAGNSYVAARMVIAATGDDLDHDTFVRHVESSFSKLKTGSTKPAPVRAGFTGSEVRFRDDAMPYAHYALAVEGVPATHQDYPALLLASTAFGNFAHDSPSAKRMASPLAHTSAEHHLAAKYSSFYKLYSDTALWGFWSVSDSHSIEDFVYEAQQTWMHLCTSFSETELARAKANLLYSLADMDSRTLLHQLGSSVIASNQAPTVASLVERITDTTVAEVKKAANLHVYDKCPAIACYGPIEQFPDYNRVRSAMYWLRL